MSLSPDLLSASSNFLCVEDPDDVISCDQDSSAAGGASVDEWVLPSTGGGDAGVDVWVVPSAAGGDFYGRPLDVILASEADHVPDPDYLGRLHSCGLDATARHDAVSWILKVNEFYRFGPATAYLSVNYLDRFLSCHSFPKGSGGGASGRWPMQLLSVACVSVAAKMEETRVPLLLDLQILDPLFVFEPRTVRRMELLLMTALRWRMRSVTPFDFLPHLTGALCASVLSSGELECLLSRTSRLILGTHRVVDFLGYRPSAIAGAAALCAAGEIGVAPPGDRGDLLSCLDEWVNKEVVSGCRQLMDQYLIDTCPTTAANGSSPVTAPSSPVGVLDAAACASCDSSALRSPSKDASDLEPPRPTKRRRLDEPRCTESIEGGDITTRRPATAIDGKN